MDVIAIAVGSVWHLNNIPDSRFQVVAIGPASATIQNVSGGVPFEISKAQFLLCYKEVR